MQNPMAHNPMAHNPMAQNPAAQQPQSQSAAAQNCMAFSLWLGVALYATIGLLGITVLQHATPTMQDATSGYGISVASAEPAPGSSK
jgi:hypothetical protein